MNCYVEPVYTLDADFVIGPDFGQTVFALSRPQSQIDLIRLAEAYPHLKALYPPGPGEQIERG